MHYRKLKYGHRSSRQTANNDNAQDGEESSENAKTKSSVAENSASSSKKRGGEVNHKRGGCGGGEEAGDKVTLQSWQVNLGDATPLHVHIQSFSVVVKLSILC